MSQIILKNIHFHAFHGVFPEENIVGNSFVVTLTLDVDLQKAAQTDDLENTVNYQSVYEVIEAQMKIPSKLIEHVAGRILNAVTATFPQVEKAAIKLEKINPPLGGQVESVAVVIASEPYKSFKL